MAAVDATGGERVTRPRVLAITSEAPWPLNSGGRLRTFHLLKSVAGAADVRLICPVDTGTPLDLTPLSRAGISVSSVGVPPRTRTAEALRLIRSWRDGEPYVMYRRHVRPEVLDRWHREMRDFRPEVAYLDHLDSFWYWEHARPERCGSVIDLHNVYSLLARRSADDHARGLTRRLLHRQAAAITEIEHRAVRSCSMVFAVSSQEADHFRGLDAKEVRLISNGVDCSSFADLPAGRSGPPVVVFVGSMSWGPNAGAAQFLARDVFPILSREIPDVRLLLIGRDPPEEVRRLGDRPGIEVTGTVPEIKPYLSRASVLAVPLDAGGGTRLKILEAFAAGLPVVSSRIGAEGLAATPGVHFHLAERENFAQAIVGALRTPEHSNRMAAAARQLALAEYDWQQIGASAAAAVVRAAP